MQFKVPQDVLRADKIVGFLTLRQLIICAIGGGLAYSMYLILNKQYFIEVWLPPVLFISLVTMAFAFVKFHEILFEKVVLLFIEYKFKPRRQTWQKMAGDTVLSVLQEGYKPQAAVKKVVQATEQERRKKLEEISRLVDTHGSSLSKHNT